MLVHCCLVFQTMMFKAMTTLHSTKSVRVRDQKDPDLEYGAMILQYFCGILPHIVAIPWSLKYIAVIITGNIPIISFFFF